MYELCFVVVDGLTKSVTSAEEEAPITRLLRKWFPQSHHHPYDPFTRTELLVAESDTLQELGGSLLQDVVQCPDCSAAYQGCQEDGGSLHNYRPIVFLGHDLGGSVIKRALVLANEDSSYRRIAKATMAIVFFGALHRTARSDPWERHIINLLAISQRDIRTVFPNIQALPAALNAISQSFIGISGSYAILNVYEKSDNATIPKHSATLDSLVTENFGSQRPHTDLLDLQEEADPAAEWLLEKLTPLTGEISTTNEEYHRFVRHLTQIEPRLHQLETISFSPGSLEWITELDSFQKWNKAPGVSFLHIFGPPSSGVTVLTSNIVWILSEARSGIDICYLNFSFNKQDILASSTEKMVLSLVRQLLSRRPRLFKHTRCLCTWIMQKKCINLEVLWVLFESLLSHIGKEPVLLAIRAIQECNPLEGDTAIIDRLLSLRRIHNLDMKIIVTSERLDWALRYSEDFHPVPMNEVDSVSDVLRGLVRCRVQRLVKTRPAWRELDEIITKVFWDQQPNYYLAMAKVQDLETESRTILSTKAAMTHRLEVFPSDTESFFLRMVRKIPQESYDWLLEALRWVFFALRPLTTRELGVAVAFDAYEYDTAEQTSLQKLEKRIPSDLPEDMNRVAGYWVKISGGRVEVTNSALKTFLIDRFMGDETIMHAKILKKCLNYLSWARMTLGTDDGSAAKPFEPSIANRPACDLLEYASLYWPFHFGMAGDVESDDIDIVQSFFENSENLKFWSDILRYHRPVDPSSDFSTSPLKALAAFGLTQLVERFLEKSVILNEVDRLSLIRGAMDLAIEQGHTDVALKLCRKLQDSGLPPGLHKVAEKGCIELLEEFLKIHSVKDSVNDLDTLGYSPLHYAAQYGQKDAVHLLLRNGGQPNLVTNDRSTALHLASMIGRVEIARLLIDYGANHRLCNAAGYNPLQLASEGGFVEIVTFLLPLYNEETHDKSERTTTPLHLAATYGHALTCTHLIQNTAVIRALDKDNMTPVHLAVLGRFKDTVRILIEADSCPPGISDMGGASERERGTRSVAKNTTVLYDKTLSPSPLQLAAEKGFVDILMLLLEHSYFYSSSSYDCNEALSRAAVEGHWKSLNALLAYTSTQNPVDSNGNSALHLACENNHIKLVNKLIDSGKYDAHFRNKAGLAPLHIAAQGGHVQVVTALLDKWTKVDCEASNGDKAIHFAAKHGHLSVVKALQQVKDMSTERDHAGDTPVLIAAMAGHAAVVDEILSALKAREGTPNLLWRDSFPLHKAVSSANEELGRILISHGYEVNSVNSDGEAPLHVAARLESVVMIKYLIRNGANPSAKNRSGETALCVAAKSGSIGAGRAILEAAPNQIMDFIDISDDGDDTPLSHACARDDKDLVQLLLDNNADPNRRCSLGWTPLHQTAVENRIEIMKLLFNAGADHNVRNDYQSTAIVLAAEAGQADAVRLLLEKGASAKVSNSSGSSALHRAAQSGHLECVTLLIEAGADFNVQKKNGIAPLHLAVANSHDNVVKYLVQRGANVNLNSQIVGSPLQAAINSSNFDPARPLVQTLIGANATTTLSGSQVECLSEEAFLFALQHPAAFDLESPGEALQHAILQDYREATLMLIESGVGINQTGGNYHTALQAAAATQSVDIMEKLLEKQADPNILGGVHGSALNATIAMNNAKAVALLLEKGAKPEIEHKGSLLIHRAVMQGSTEIVKTMLDYGANPTVRDKNGRSLLSHAMHSGSAAVVDCLLTRSDIPIDDADFSGRTPLMTAVMLDKHDIVKRLLDMNVDPNARDSEEKTPLIRAVTSWELNLNLIKTLLKHNADPSLKDCRGRGVLYWACLSGKDGRDTLIEDMIFPLLRTGGELSLCGELAFQAAASLTAETTPSKQQAVVDILLRSTAKLDLEERDGDGWTATYTATRFRLAAVEESLAQTMILHGVARKSGGLERPTAWHRRDKAPCLEVSEDGKSVSVGEAPMDPNDTLQPRATIRANHCMPGDGVYYFEVTIDENAYERIIGVGFCEEHTPLDRMVGWDPGSWGYHGDDGKTFTYAVSSRGNEYDRTYSKGFTIGCGVNFEKETAFFTMDGELIGPAFHDIKGKLYPAVSFSSEQPLGRITANFGPDSFKYKDWKSNRNTVDRPPTTKRTEPIPPTSNNNENEDNDDSDLEWEFARALR